MGGYEVADTDSLTMASDGHGEFSLAGYRRSHGKGGGGNGDSSQPEEKKRQIPT